MSLFSLLIQSFLQGIDEMKSKQILIETEVTEILSR